MNKLIVLTAIVALSSSAFAARKIEPPKRPTDIKQERINKGTKARSGTRSTEAREAIAENTAMEAAFGAAAKHVQALASDSGLVKFFGEKGTKMITESTTSFVEALKTVESSLEKDRSPLNESKLKATSAAKEAAPAIAEVVMLKVSGRRISESDKNEVIELLQLFYVMSAETKAVVVDSKDIKTVENYEKMAQSIVENIKTANVDVKTVVNNIVKQYLKVARGIEDATEAEIKAFKAEMRTACKMPLAA